MTQMPLAIDLAFDLKVDCPNYWLIAGGVVIMLIGALLDRRRGSIASKASAAKTRARARQEATSTTIASGTYGAVGVGANIVELVVKRRVGAVIALVGLLLVLAGLLRECKDEEAKSTLRVASQSAIPRMGAVEVAMRCQGKSERCSADVRLVSRGGRLLAGGPAVLAADTSAAVRLRLTTAGRRSLRAHSSVDATVAVDGRASGVVTIRGIGQLP